MGVLSNAIMGVAHSVQDHLPMALGGHTADAAPAAMGAENTSFAESGGWEFRKYVADACPHCRHLKPAWDQAEGAYSGPVKFRNITCADDNWQPVKENEKLCENVMGFPTIKMFKGDTEVEEYQGGRSAEAMGNFVKNFDTTQTPTAAYMPLAALVGASMFQSANDVAEDSDRKQTIRDFM